MKDMQGRIRAVYRAHPNASRLQVAQALGLEKPTPHFDTQLVKVQARLRGRIPFETFTIGEVRVETYGQPEAGYGNWTDFARINGCETGYHK